ncbi:MAG TPA: DUF4203 domain-containing protein [Anaerolineae bacterium]|nr:DUF4203 domain-containing protein [Anaerolineae bacterium]
MLAQFLGGLLLLLIGLVFVFYGYRIFLVMLPVWGFFAGFWMGANALTLLFGHGFLATTTGWIVGFFVGVFVALFSYLFYFLGVAIVAGIVGYGLGVGFMGVFGLSGGILAFIVGVIVALVVIVLTLVLNLQKYVVIALTAFGGGVAAVAAVLVMFGQLTVQTLREQGDALVAIANISQLWVLAALVLAIIGIIWQLRSNRTYEFHKAYYVQSWG